MVLAETDKKLPSQEKIKPNRLLGLIADAATQRFYDKNAKKDLRQDFQQAIKVGFEYDEQSKTRRTREIVAGLWIKGLRYNFLENEEPSIYVKHSFQNRNTEPKLSTDMPKKNISELAAIGQDVLNHDESQGQFDEWFNGLTEAYDRYSRTIASSGELALRD